MSNEMSLVPFAEVKQMAIAVASSKLFGMKTPEEALSLMMLAQAEGMHPITAARDYDIIQGRPAKKSEAMLRDFMRAGGKVEWHSLSDTEADATFSHPVGGEVRITWNMQRAIAAELGTKPMWKKYPRQMLRSRVVSEGVRTVYPGATSGLYEVGEVSDMEPKPPGPKPPIVTVDQALEKAKAANEKDWDRVANRAAAEGAAESGDDLPVDTKPATPPKPSPVKPLKPGEKPREITGPQFSRLWAIADAQGWHNTEIHDYMLEKLGIKSGTELTKEQYDALVSHIETYPPNRPN